jgi:glutathione S-transferase
MGPRVYRLGAHRAALRDCLRRFPQLRLDGKLPAMKLYTYYRSTAAFRVRIALNLKGVPFETISMHLRNGAHRTPEFLAMNPQGLIPALDDDGVCISQSLAIIEYLEEKYPSPPLLPGAGGPRARTRHGAQRCGRHASAQQPACAQLPAQAAGPRRKTVNEIWYHTGFLKAFAGWKSRRSAGVATASTCSAPA